MVLTQLLLLFYACVSSNAYEFDLKVEYFEQVINTSKNEASKYEPRKSNGDFLDSANLNTTNDFGSFDFIIIGAGSTGSAIANRLSEVEKWKILVLEAGAEYDDFASIPDSSAISAQSHRNWGYYSVPQKNGFLGLVNNSFFYPRGKIVGGTGSINGVIYARGHKADFDNWKMLGWSYRDVLPYFKKAENLGFDSDEPSYHGFGGPLNVQYAPSCSPLLSSIINASVESGLKQLDYHGHRQIGVSRLQSNVRFGRRECGANRYIEPALARRNFNLVTEAFVTKILIENRVAKGVQFVHGGKLYVARITKEVILSAGAINSPQILMLSGVGPRTDLEKLHIKVKANLPVGLGLLDHPIFTTIVRTNHTEVEPSLKQNVKNWLNNRCQLAVPAGFSVIAFKDVVKKGPRPDIELLFVPPTPSEPVVPRNQGEALKEDILGKINQATDLLISSVLLHQKSKGSVKLASASPRDFPLIDFNIFDEVDDVETLYQSVNFIKTIVKAPALQKYNATLIIPELRDCKHLEVDSKEHWYCLIRHFTSTIYHASSTVRMARNSREGCVDRKLKVFGVNKLRVADISVLPTSVAGHPNAAAFMVGERVSDLIKKEHGIFIL